jgi:hypothetical protein
VGISWNVAQQTALRDVEVSQSVSQPLISQAIPVILCRFH